MFTPHVSFAVMSDFNLSRRLSSVATAVSLGLIGFAAPLQAQPEIDFGDAPPRRSPATSPIDIDVPPPVVVPPPPPPGNTPAPAEEYLVYVSSSDPQVLELVRTINPSAEYGLFQGQRIIQAGLFSNRNAADVRSQQLAAAGIQSGIAAVAVTEPNVPDSTPDAPYYVVVPGSDAELSRYMDDIRAAVSAGTPVEMRDRPLGEHLAIGPFARRRTAERLSERLQQRGLRQTRVYYDR